MEFGHEKLDVYRLSLDFVSFVLERYDLLNGRDRNLRDQLVRASQSIPLNIAEGSGKWGPRESARFFQIARGSECAAAVDMLRLSGGLMERDVVEAKEQLHRMASMLSKLISQRYSRLREEAESYIWSRQRLRLRSRLRSRSSQGLAGKVNVNRGAGRSTAW